jgi:dTDP-4-amino-4,6-dideoxygalactose transaminase
VFHIYQVAVQRREALRDFLMDKGIETKIHYPNPIHWQKAAAYLGHKKGDFPVCDRLAGEILSLPVRENLSDEEVHYICDQVSAFYKR